MLIVYAEDEPFTRVLVKKMLEQDSHTVVEAHNGIVGLKKFLEVKPDLVITDLAMPEMDGFAFIDKVRQHDCDVPIIVTTAYRDEVSRVEDKITGCIFKPVIRNQLLDIVRTTAKN